MALKCEIGFELQGRFTMDAADPPGFEGGEVVPVYFEGHEQPVNVTVTKSIIVDGRRLVTFCTPMVIKIG